MSIERKLLLLITALLALTAIGCSPAHSPSAVERGAYLVSTIGCADCHTPARLGPNGPELDPARHLSGHPETIAIEAAPALPDGGWAFAGNGTMTAWTGPWGVSFTANLTPDRETGLGTWTPEMFRLTIRNGRHMGSGRPLLPPMPFAFYRNLSDEDLDAIFAYLQSIPAVHNRVPQPVAPTSD